MHRRGSVGPWRKRRFAKTRKSLISEDEKKRVENVCVDDEKLGFVMREFFGDLWRERKMKRFVDLL